jgi:HD superfamily phosphodiesterase
MYNPITIMKKRFEEIWKLAIPYLRKGKRKNFVLHTKGVIKAVGLLLKQKKGDEDVLIPAAILHDTGWSKVPLNLQKTKDKSKTKRAMELHLIHSVPIINEILTKLRYDKKQIKKIIDAILAHKFKNPKDLNKRLLIDADTLADAFKEQFYGDCKEYNLTPETLYKTRKNNKFYTKTARIVFDKGLEKRRKEFSGAQN